MIPVNTSVNKYLDVIIGSDHSFMRRCNILALDFVAIHFHPLGRLGLIV